MEKKELNNVLIAKFMNCSITNGVVRRKDNTNSCFIEDLRYDTSWDWLMPVVEKIEGLSVDGFDIDPYSDENRECEWQFSVNIFNGGCTIDRDVLPQYSGTEDDFLSLYSCLKTNKVQSTYEAVIAFIQWYNKHLITD